MMEEYIEIFNRNKVKFLLRKGWLYCSVKWLSVMPKEDAEKFVLIWNKRRKEFRQVFNLETGNFKIKKNTP